MNTQFMLNSIGIGGTIFVGLVIFWFVFVYLKRRLTSDATNRSISAPTQISWKEKRQHPRIEIKWPAVIQGPNQNSAVQLKDISLGGAFVVCQEPPDLPGQFKILITSPDNSDVLLNAVMVWSNFNVPKDKVVNRGMGIKFINNEPEERQRLRDAIATTIENNANPPGH